MDGDELVVFTLRYVLISSLFRFGFHVVSIGILVWFGSLLWFDLVLYIDSSLDSFFSCLLFSLLIWLSFV